jgi:hypothetical protein
MVLDEVQDGQDERECELFQTRSANQFGGKYLEMRAHTKTTFNTMKCRNANSVGLVYMTQRGIAATVAATRLRRMAENKFDANRGRFCWQENWTREGE